MEDGAEEEPDSEGDPFGVSEVAGEGGDELHQEKKQRDTDAERGDETHAEAPLDEPKRGAGGQPTERGGHRANFGDGDEDGVAK